MRFKSSTLMFVIAFVASTGVLVAIVGMTFSQIRIDDHNDYSAVFADASGLRNNVDVRGSGVSIGKITGIERRQQGGVLVSFTVPKNLEMTSSTKARIRYANLTGDRYLDLTPGTAADAATLKPGATIPESRTQAALDLDELFAGFGPLMEALDPEQVNKLTTNIIGVTEGQAGSYKAMLANVGSFTNNLASRDKLIGEVITELSQTLTTLDEHRGDVDKLVVDLDHLTTGLQENQTAIVGGLADLSTLGTQAADFLEAVRPGLTTNIDNLGTVAKNLNDVEPFVTKTLKNAALGLSRVGRLASNGSMFNFFLCGTRVQFDVPGSKASDPVSVFSPTLYAKDDRCQKGTN